MTAYSLPTIKALFAKSGNRCAFPDCPELLICEDGLVVGQICHIRASSPRGPRYDPLQPDCERHAGENLILLCAKHHKAIDAQPEIYTVSVIGEMKNIHEEKCGRSETESDSVLARILIASQPSIAITAQHSNVAINSPGAVQAQTIVLKRTGSSTKLMAPVGTVGADGDALAYTKRLIDRYNEFAMKEPSRSKQFSYAAIYTAIKAQFGCPWNLVPMSRFEELCVYLEWRISRTRVAKSNTARGKPTTSSFDAYLAKYRR